MPTRSLKSRKDTMLYSSDMAKNMIEKASIILGTMLDSKKNDRIILSVGKAKQEWRRLK